MFSRDGSEAFSGYQRWGFHEADPSVPSTSYDISSRIRAVGTIMKPSSPEPLNPTFQR